ncbi:PrsW family intramembrane metalloprotease [Candidatus Bathyarchaeota archaeon]|nr:PrsW family intramembrane metalloprotease [Candidatus Bathyarchaeota archaeon]
MAAVLLLTGMLLSFGDVWIQYLGISVAGFAAPVLCLIWMIKNDRYEAEPLSLVAYTFGWGAFCAIFASILNKAIIPYLGVSGAAFVEEPLKIIGVYWLAMHRVYEAELNDHLDGMIYGAAVGAGFAGLENFAYIYTMIMNQGVSTWSAVAFRSAASLNHIVWSAVAGRSVGLAEVLRGYSKRMDIVPGLAVAIPLHFLWNYVNPVVALFILLPFNLLALARMTRTAQMDEANWGYKTSAPVE